MSEMYHLNANESDVFDQDDLWQPFDNHDAPPSDDEDHPPSDSELHSDPDDGMDGKIDELPVIEETPPEPEKRPRERGRPSSSSSKRAHEPHEDIAARKEADEIQRAFDRLDRGTRQHQKSGKSERGRIPAPVRAKKGKALPKEEVEKHMALMLKIDKYRLSPRFAECLARSRLPLVNIELLTVEELDDLLTRVKVVVRNRHASTGGMLGSGIVMVAGIGEKVAVAKGIPTMEGYAASLSQDPEFADLCEELSIDYSIMQDLSPEQRMIWCLGMNAMKVHALNKFRMQMAGGAPNPGGNPGEGIVPPTADDGSGQERNL